MKHWLSPLAFFFAVAATAQEKPSLQTLRIAAAKLQPHLQMKTRPDVGDWLAEHHEDGQAFDQYLGLSKPPDRRTHDALHPAHWQFCKSAGITREGHRGNHAHPFRCAGENS